MISVELLNKVLKSISKYNQQILMCAYGNKDIVKKIIINVKFNTGETVFGDLEYKYINLYYANGERGVIAIEELIKILEE